MGDFRVERRSLGPADVGRVADDQVKARTESLKPIGVHPLKRLVRYALPGVTPRTASAGSLMSLATTRHCGRSAAKLIARQPLPVHRSKTFASEGSSSSRLSATSCSESAR